MSEVYRTVTWDELGCPTEPINIEYDGMTLSVKQWHKYTEERSADLYIWTSGTLYHRTPINGRFRSEMPS